MTNKREKKLYSTCSYWHCHLVSADVMTAIQGFVDVFRIIDLGTRSQSTNPELSGIETERVKFFFFIN